MKFGAQLGIMPTAYKSLTFTIRPRHGVPQGSKIEDLIIKYLKKHAGFLCAEKEDEDPSLCIDTIQYVTVVGGQVPVLSPTKNRRRRSMD